MLCFITCLWFRNQPFRVFSKQRSTELGGHWVKSIGRKSQVGTVPGLPRRSHDRITLLPITDLHLWLFRYSPRRLTCYVRFTKRSTKSVPRAGDPFANLLIFGRSFHKLASYVNKIISFCSQGLTTLGHSVDGVMAHFQKPLLLRVWTQC